MGLNIAFLLANVTAVTGWIMLLTGVVLRRSLIDSARAVRTLLVLAYMILFLLHAREAGVLIRDYSLQGVGAIFSYPGLALAGWIHYLAFDLWVRGPGKPIRRRQRCRAG